ncbi:MAG: transporter [Syntrophobacteraceae bacterium]
MKTTIQQLLIVPALVITIAIGFAPSATRAEEAGSGHYMPGATASFIDALPGREAFAYLNAFTFYNGSAGAGRTLQLGGVIAANIDATVYADTSILLYETSWKFLGGQYAAALVIPYVWMEVKGDVQVNKITRSRRDLVDGIGDIEMFPLILGWKHGDLKYDARLGIYAPTGEFEKGRLANVGKNFWTFEPGISASYLSSKIGLELSAFAGLDFNTKNDATDYQSGDTFHLDITVAEHLPLFGGFIGVGVNGFHYQQFTGDSGSGARLGSFESRTTGIGPVVSYATKICNRDLVAEVKWLPELDTGKRLNGEYVWFKVAALF